MQIKISAKRSSQLSNIGPACTARVTMGTMLRAAVGRNECSTSWTVNIDEC